MKKYEKLIYTAHPYSGLKKNEEKIANIILELQKQYPNYLFISPIHCFSYAYHKTDYQTGIDMCLNLLNMCDEMWVFGDWKNSKGCNMEIEHCKQNGIQYYIK